MLLKTDSAVPVYSDRDQPGRPLAPSEFRARKSPVRQPCREPLGGEKLTRHLRHEMLFREVFSPDDDSLGCGWRNRQPGVQEYEKQPPFVFLPHGPSGASATSFVSPVLNLTPSMRRGQKSAKSEPAMPANAGRLGVDTGHRPLHALEQTFGGKRLHSSRRHAAFKPGRHLRGRGSSR